MDECSSLLERYGWLVLWFDGLVHCIGVGWDGWLIGFHWIVFYINYFSIDIRAVSMSTPVFWNRIILLKQS